MKTVIFAVMMTIVLLCSVGSISQGSHEKMTPLEKLRHQVGWYESRNNHNVRPGDNGLALGKYQFHKRTFNWMKGMAGMPNLDIACEEDQKILFDWAQLNGYGRHWSPIRDGRVKSPFKMKHEHVRTKQIVAYTGVYSKHKTPSVHHFMIEKPELLTIKL